MAKQKKEDMQPVETPIEEMQPMETPQEPAAPVEETHPEETPQEPLEELVDEDQKKADELIEAHGVKVIYKVGKYWITNRQYAEEASKRYDKKLKTFEKSE